MTLGEDEDRSTGARDPVRLPVVQVRPSVTGGATVRELRMEDGRSLLVYSWPDEARP